MRLMAPEYEELLDHTGKPRAEFAMPLTCEQARLGMAFHEAGHGVLSMACGMHIVKTEVIAWETDAGGWAVTGKTTHHADGIPPWRFAAQCAAGEAAHVHYLRQYGLWTPEREAACVADHDREYAIDVLAEFGYRLGCDHTPEGGKSWTSIRAVADRTVRLLWRQIASVAHAMDTSDRLTGAEVATLTGLVNPERTGGAA